MADTDYNSVRSHLRYDTPSMRGRPSTRKSRNPASTPYRLKSAEKYLSRGGQDTGRDDPERYSRSSSPLFLREQMKAEAQIRAERDNDLKTLRRSVSPKRPKSPNKSPNERSTSPLPLRYSNYASAATPYEEYRSAISSLRNLRDTPSYIRSLSPPGKEIIPDDSAINLAPGRAVSGVTLDSGIAGGGSRHDVEVPNNYSVSTVNLNNTSPLGGMKSNTWHKLDKDGLQDAIEESEQRRMLLVNRLKDAQDTLKLQASTINSLKNEKERLKLELEGLSFSKEESHNEKRNLTTRIKLMKSKCDELDEEVSDLRRTSESFKSKMEEKTRLLNERTGRINELENELAAIRLSSADNGDQISKLQDSYDRVRTHASLLEQQNSGLSDDNKDLKQTNEILEAKCKDVKTQLDEAEIAITQLKGDMAILERERRELDEERRTVISHKLDTQEALTKANQVNMELQSQIDKLIDCRDTADKENDKLSNQIRDVRQMLSSKDTEAANTISELEALQRENNTLREINESLKDRLDDMERAKTEAENLIDILKEEKSNMEDSKSKMFHEKENLAEEIKVAKIEIADRKHENEMILELKEDERKEKLQIQEMLDTLRQDADTQRNYLETQCEDLEKDVQRLQSELDRLQTENKKLTRDLADSQNDASYNKGKAEEWKSTAQSLEDSLNLSENERKGVVEDLLRVQNELTDLKDDYGVVADERNRFLDKYSELQGECEHLQEEVRELLLEKDENQHVVRLLETQKAILEEKWNGGKDLEAAQTECVELREDIKATRDRVKILEQQCDDVSNELQISREKVATLLEEKKRAQENIGRADKTIELLNTDKDRLQSQVAAVTKEFERKVATLEGELEAEQERVLQRSQDNSALKRRLDEALNLHGTEKADLIKERNDLDDRITAQKRINHDIQQTLGKRNTEIEELEADRRLKNTKEAKLADALKAITGNPDVEDPYVEAATFMRTVKREKEDFEREARKIPGLEQQIASLSNKLDAAEQSNDRKGSEIELKSASIEQLQNSKGTLEKNVDELTTQKAELEKTIERLEGEKKKLDKLEVEHARLNKDHMECKDDLEESKRNGKKVSDERDAVDVENKRVKAENAKLSMELADIKKSLASKSDGEKAMLEASSELRIVRGELENLMAIIDTKDEKIEQLNSEIEELTEKLQLVEEETVGRNEEIKTLRSQIREADRKLERSGELDLDNSAVIWEKEEQLKRLEKWVDSYKTKLESLERAKQESEDERNRLRDEKKIMDRQMKELHETVEALENEVDVMKEVLVETEAERETLQLHNQELTDNLDKSLGDWEAQEGLEKRLQNTEDELRTTKKKLQMSEDDMKQKLGGYDINDLKTPDEVAKIIEDIKEAFEDEIADLLLAEREEYEKEKSQFEKERDDFRFEQEEFLRQAEEIASEQVGNKNNKMDEMQSKLDDALEELRKYKSGS